MATRADPGTPITRYDSGPESPLAIITNEPETSSLPNENLPISNGATLVDNCLKAAFVGMMESQVGLSSKISPSLELFDSSTRMLLSNCR